jgi:Domain of unknown function (DUF6927)
MGWLYRDEPIDDPLTYLKAKYNYDCETHTLQTLDGARVRNTVYLAVRSTDKKTGRSLVFAAVILISNTKKSGFGYKDMDEGMGPCECACPQRIIRLLSPIADLPHPRYTAEWRARVAAYHDEQRQHRKRCTSLSVGTILTLRTATRFSDGITASEFRVAHFRRRTPIFEPVDRPGFLCRLRATSLAAAIITPPTSRVSADG